MSDPTGQVQIGQQQQADELVRRADEMLLRQAHPADAAGIYAQALQLVPNLLAAHLGMAEANFALGQMGIAKTAAEYVMRIAPGTNDADVAQAIALSIDHNYLAALSILERLEKSDPGRAYAHGLRGYVLRNVQRDYDASLAESKASRLASSADFRSLFPPVQVAPTIATAFPGQTGQTGQPNQQWTPPVQPRQSPISPVRRQMIRTSFAVRGYPIATYTIIGICVFIYLIQQVKPGILYSGAQDNTLVPTEPWRLFTAMFLHLNILHILFNMLALWSIGSIIERIYGISRFLLIYFGAGLTGSLLFYFLVPGGAAVGASGAIAGIFGAFGAFFFAYRSQLGPVANSMLQQWGFWLVLNIAINFSNASSLGWQAHLGGLVAGMILGYFLAPANRR